MRRLLSALLCVCVLGPPDGWSADAISVGSKRFTESYLLAEIVTRTIDEHGETRAHHRPGLGNTAVVFAALKSGAIDLYPEYSGTIALELLHLPKVPDLQALNRALAPHGVSAGVPLGFSNSYALAMSQAQAKTLGIARVSDLARHPGLRLGLSQEFLNRKDGWPALANAYRLGAVQAIGLDHGLAYDALQKGQVDVIDVYTTDAKIAAFGLTILADDAHFFPEYEALLVYRSDLPQRFPQSWAAVRTLEGRISAESMRDMNAAVELQGAPFGSVAAGFLGRTVGMHSPSAPGFINVLFGTDFWRLTREHALLVLASLALGIAVGVPLGICAWRNRALRYWILGVAGVLQTVPALALLAFLIAVTNQIGTAPAIIALFLYALLPIVRNTEAGLSGIPPGLTQSAVALGLAAPARLRLIELPLAAPLILAGVRTAAVINVGTATIAAFVGAGGYGERIVAGLAVNNHALLLAGAVPAAAMAVAIEWGLTAVERYLFPPGSGVGGRSY